MPCGNHDSIFHFNQDDEYNDLVSTCWPLLSSASTSNDSMPATDNNWQLLVWSINQSEVSRQSATIPWLIPHKHPAHCLSQILSRKGGHRAIMLTKCVDISVADCSPPCSGWQMVSRCVGCLTWLAEQFAENFGKISICIQYCFCFSQKMSINTNALGNLVRLCYVLGCGVNKYGTVQKLRSTYSHIKSNKWVIWVIWQTNQK